MSSPLFPRPEIPSLSPPPGTPDAHRQNEARWGVKAAEGRTGHLDVWFATAPSPPTDAAVAQPLYRARGSRGLTGGRPTISTASEPTVKIVEDPACPPGSAFVTDGRGASRIDLPEGWSIFAS